MRRVVLDAGSLLTWFVAGGSGRGMRAEYEAGQLTVIAPRTIGADAIALLAGRQGWDGPRLERAAVELGRLGIEVHDPPLAGLARWIANGLAADRAAYPALAESLDLRLVTDDARLQEVAAAVVGA